MHYQTTLQPKTRHLFTLILIAGMAASMGPFTWFSKKSTSLTSRQWANKEIALLKAKTNNLDTHVLKLGLIAFQKAKKQGLNPKPILTIIDYSKPSFERRLWVIDLAHHQVLFNTHVAHGKNSGNVYSNSFSNQSRSLKSSYGVFLTEEIYSGGHGASLRIQGMEPGINDNVHQRSVVFHGAPYVSETIAKTQGRIGRSFGCMAVSEKVIKPLIQTIQHHTLVFAYYPDSTWLKTSSFLQ